MLKCRPPVGLSSRLRFFCVFISLLTFFVSYTSYAIVKKKGQIVKTKTLLVYSSRKEQLIRPVFEAYEKFYNEQKDFPEDESVHKGIKSNKVKASRRQKIKIKFLTGQAQALVQKIKIEGEQSEVDLFLTVDAGSLYHAKKEKLFFPIKYSPIIEKNVPFHLRDQDGAWVALSLRARPIFYHSKRVKPKDLSSYAELGKSHWKKRLCLRTSKKVYTQFLVASLISHLGEKKTESIVKSWVENLATSVFFSDTRLLKAIEAGQCDVGIANAYYYARILRDNPRLQVKLFWPNQKGRGTHINISGVGLLKNSRNKKEAQKLIEWLVGKKAQKMFADLNLEYPVSPYVSPHPVVQSFGSFKEDKMPLIDVAKNQSKALLLLDKVKYE